MQNSFQLTQILSLLPCIYLLSKLSRSKCWVRPHQSRRILSAYTILGTVEKESTVARFKLSRDSEVSVHQRRLGIKPGAVSFLAPLGSEKRKIIARSVRIFQSGGGHRQLGPADNQVC